MVVQIPLTEDLFTLRVIGVLFTDVIIYIIRDVENIPNIIHIFHQLSEVRESEGGVCGS